MKKEFDPYFDWLKIPPGTRPPSHYALLGVSADETDSERIDEAAAVRMEKVRARALGQHGEVATRLLNEISKAIDCLSNPQQRREYDLHRQESGSTDSSPEQPRRNPPELPTLAETLESSEPLSEPESHPSDKVTSCPSDKVTSWSRSVAVAGGVCVVSLGMAAMLMFSSWSSHEPRAEPLAAMADGTLPRDPVARRQIRERRFSQAMTLVFGNTKDFAGALATLQANRRDFPTDHDLLRECAWSAWCAAHLRQWSETWESYREARTRSGRFLSDHSRHELAAEWDTLLMEVREIVFLSDEPTAVDIWSKILALEKELGCQATLSTGIEDMFGQTAWDTWRGRLFRLVVFEKEIHLLIEPTDGSPSIEALIEDMDFAEQIRDYRSVWECGVADEVIVHGLPFSPEDEKKVEVADTADKPLQPKYRLDPEASLVVLHEIEIVDEPGSLAKRGERCRHVFRKDDSIGSVAWHLQTPPTPSSEKTISLEGLVSWYENISSSQVGDTTRTFWLIAHPDAKRLVEVRLTPETKVLVDDVGRGDRLRIEAWVVESDLGRFVVAAKRISSIPNVLSQSPFPEVDQVAPTDPKADEVAEPEPEPIQVATLPNTKQTTSLQQTHPSVPSKAPDPWTTGAVDQAPRRFTVSAASRAVTSIAFSSDGKQLVTTGNTLVCVWNMADGTRTHTITDHNAEVTAAVFEPKTLAAKQLLLASSAQDQYLGIFDLNAPKQPTKQALHGGSPLLSLAWRPDGHMLAAGLDSGHFILIDPTLRRSRIERRWAFSGPVVAMAWTPFTIGSKNTRLLTTADRDGFVWLWDLKNSRIPLYGRIDWNTPLAQTFKKPKSLLARTLSDGTLKIVDRPVGRCRQIAWSPPSRKLLAVALNGLELWDFSEKQGFAWSAHQLPPTTSSLKLPILVNSLAFNHDGTLLALGTEDPEVLVLDLVRFTIIHRLSVVYATTALAWSPSVNCLAAGDRSGKVTVWDIP